MLRSLSTCVLHQVRCQLCFYVKHLPNARQQRIEPLNPVYLKHFDFFVILLLNLARIFYMLYIFHTYVNVLTSDARLLDVSVERSIRQALLRNTCVV